MPGESDRIVIDDTRELLAFHEAGHAAMACDRGRAFRYVTIVEEDDSLGHVLYRRFSLHFQPEMSAGGRDDRRLDVLVDCALAGLAAEGILRDVDNLADWKDAGAESDIEHASMFARYRNGSEEAAVTYLRWRWYVVRDRLRFPLVWDSVKAIARALLDRERVSYNEARALFKGCTMYPRKGAVLAP